MGAHCVLYVHICASAIYIIYCIKKEISKATESEVWQYQNEALSKATLMSSLCIMKVFPYLTVICFPLPTRLQPNSRPEPAHRVDSECGTLGYILILHCFKKEFRGKNLPEFLPGAITTSYMGHHQDSTPKRSDP